MCEFSSNGDAVMYQVERPKKYFVERKAPFVRSLI